MSKLSNYHDSAQSSISSAKIAPLTVESPLCFPFWGPWYLTVYGMIIRDADRAHDQAEAAEDEPVDQSDSPVFSAVNFETIVKYLPCIPKFSHKFERGPDGKQRQIGQLFYVVEGDDKIVTDASEVGLRHRRVGDPWLSIFVADTRRHAKELTTTYGVFAETKAAANGLDV
ncbi:hypothetical protein C8R47DRAFT_1213763 [Mycena vitilis]|nr:hypothetical protein C8R47DRAFT_1213763 [Mycena vitilis]